MMWQVAVVFVFLPIIIGQALETGDKCTNSKGEEATCTNIFSCKAVIDAVAVSNGSKLYAGGEICGYDINPLVCCITITDFEKIIPSGVPSIDLIISGELLVSNDSLQIFFELPDNLSNISEIRTTNHSESLESNENPDDTSDEEFDCCECSDDPESCRTSQSTTTVSESSSKPPEVFTESTKNSDVNPLQLSNTSESTVTQFWENLFTRPSEISTESPQPSIVPDLQSNNGVEESDPNLSTTSKVISESGEVFTSPLGHSTESSSVKDVTTSTTSKPSIDVLPLQSNETFESVPSTEESSESYGNPAIPDYYPEHSVIDEEVPIQMFAHEVLPGRDVCGFQLERKRMPNAIIASIDEFPWVALLRYQDAYGHDLGFKCVGTLITDRYVITSSLCTTVGPENFQLKSVRLGEWSISNPTDCVFDYKRRVCPDKFVDIGIEKKIPHPNHSSDLALLRMERNVDFTDFVRPICLPIEHLEVPSHGAMLMTSGWGASEAGCLLDIKSKIPLPVLPKEDCPKAIFRDMTVYEDQVCVNAASKNKICKTDTGGPVMEWHTAHQDRWYLEGVIPKRFNCDNHGFRGVYTRVTKYIPWIVSTIREDGSHEYHSHDDHSQEDHLHENHSQE